MKPMKCFILFLLSLFLGTTSFSQEKLSIGVTGGLGRIFSNTTSFNSNLDGFEYGANFNSSRFLTGISLNYRINEKWEIASQFHYGVSRYQFGIEYVAPSAYRYLSRIQNNNSFIAIPLRLYRQILSIKEERNLAWRAIIGGQYYFNAKQNKTKLIGEKKIFSNKNTPTKPFIAQWGIRSANNNQFFVQGGTGVTKTFDNGDRLAIDLIFSLGIKKLVKGQQFGFYNVENVDYEYDYDKNEFKFSREKPDQQFDFFSRGTSLNLNFTYYFSLEKSIKTF